MYLCLDIFAVSVSLSIALLSGALVLGGILAPKHHHGHGHGHYHGLGHEKLKEKVKYGLWPTLKTCPINLPNLVVDLGSLGLGLHVLHVVLVVANLAINLLFLLKIVPDWIN